MDWILLSLLGVPLFSVIPHTLAYIDPGTGSIILQAVVAAVAGAAIAVKIYWQRLRRFFGSGKSIHHDPSDHGDDREK